MTDRRLLIHSLFLVGLPVLVAWFGLSTATAVVLVVFALLWRWAISLSGIFAPEKSPRIVLETTAASHFAEKVRWCLDRLGLEYVERQSAGVIGVVFVGRTVPRLKLRTGIVRSSLGNSPEILRYLWGAYAEAAEMDAGFLEPTAQRLALEKRIDRYGVDLQVWVFYHLLPNRDLALRVWGVDSPLVPWWQKQLIRLLFPALAFFIRTSFSITDEHFAKAKEHIDQLLADIDTRLADGRRSILGGDTPDFADIAFASISGLWLQPPNYGGGKAEPCRLARNRLPAPMRDDIERWLEDHPKASAFVARLYAEERYAGTNSTKGTKGNGGGQIQAAGDEAAQGAEQ